MKAERMEKQPMILLMCFILVMNLFVVSWTLVDIRNDIRELKRAVVPTEVRTVK